MPRHAGVGMCYLHFFVVNTKESVIQPQIYVVQHNRTITKVLETWNNCTLILNMWEFQLRRITNAVKHVFVEDATNLPSKQPWKKKWGRTIRFQRDLGLFEI